MDLQKEKGVIYVLTDPEGTVRYVGHTKNDLKYAVTRIRSAVKNNSLDTDLHRWVKEVGLYGFGAKVVEKVSDSQRRERFRFWVGQYPETTNYKAPEKPSTGRTVPGPLHLTPEHIEAIRKAQTGKQVSQETRRKISEARKGHSDNKGQKRSEETKRKMSHSQHVTRHEKKNITNDKCNWCAGEVFSN